MRNPREHGSHPSARRSRPWLEHREGSSEHSERFVPHPAKRWRNVARTNGLASITSGRSTRSDPKLGSHLMGSSEHVAHRCHTMRSRRDLIGQRPHRSEVEGLGHRRELVDIAGAGFEVHPEALLDPNHEGQRVILFVLVHGLSEDDNCEISLKLMNDQGAGMVVDTINKSAERARARLTDLDGLLQDAGWRKARPRTSADRMA